MKFKPLPRDIKTTAGFTLLEILLVAAAIAILAGIVILAINPGKQLSDTKNAQRQIDVRTILDAVYQYSVDTSGTLPVGITTNQQEVCRTGVNCANTQVDLSVLTNNAKYLVSIPFDPTATGTVTGYFISKTASGRVTVTAPYAENGTVISVTR